MYFILNFVHPPFLSCPRFNFNLLCVNPYLCVWTRSWGRIFLFLGNLPFFFFFPFFLIEILFNRFLLSLCCAFGYYIVASG